MGSLDTYDDYHYFIRGAIALSPDELYSHIVSSVKKHDFLRIVDGNESTRVIRIVSDRREDPRGITEITIQKAPYGARFYFRFTDEEFLSLVNHLGMVARYGIGFKQEDSIGGLLLEDATEEAKRQYRTKSNTVGKARAQALT